LFGAFGAFGAREFPIPANKMATTGNERQPVKILFKDIT
jgi:hypothetical protein